MAHGSSCSLRNLAILLLLFIVQSSKAHEKTKVFLSPKFELKPGSVAEKYYYNIDFPKGHIAIKSFNAEVIDEQGNSIPLHETYLHHWVVLRYHQRKGLDISKHSGDLGFLKSDHIIVKNSGICDKRLYQYFGLGSETRRTKTSVPEPYGIEVGNQEDIPDGYEERWLLNVHAIDTRGAEDKSGCIECRCDLYNVTEDQFGRVLPPSYKGGLYCCYDDVRCKVKEEFRGVEKKGLYLRYTVKYVDWDTSIVPVKIYIIDVTDIWTKADESRGMRDSHCCLVEYEIEPCPIAVANDGCTHKKSVSVSLPTGGDVIYGGGRVICSSNPTYGIGKEPGNEAGYIVGVSTCYPSPSSLKISAGEMLTLVSKYNSTKTHTGVMGLFYLLIADPSAENPNVTLNSQLEAHKSVVTSNFGWAIVLFGAALVGIVVLVFQRRRKEGYEAIPT
ncbi:hypothetical protein ACJIZ3_010163 [Penstemon smallii]|uniref:Uncharacterized protein n=1 Tax=Penstemon smallii TaxID=265156 RepID=A0ABD3TEI5_9LAMI